MSTWRLICKTLHDRGPMSLRDLEGYVETEHDLYGAAYKASRLGLLNLPGKHYQPEARPITLTQHGVDYCEGRLTLSSQRPGGRRLVATWLMALPRGVRIEQGAGTC